VRRSIDDTPINISDIMADLNLMHVSYLNRQHDEMLLKEWRECGIFDEIGRRLGYRFVVKNVEYKCRQGSRLIITAENVGFANIYNDVNVFLILTAAETHASTRRKLTGVNPKDWNPHEDVQIEYSVDNIPCASDIDVYIGMERADDGRCIYFANEGAEKALWLGTIISI